MGSGGSRRHGFWSLAVVALVGLLVQACSDNKGPAGPSFPSGQTGHADTAAQIIVRVAINSGTIELNRRAGVTVVVTNLNGRPLANRLVQLSTDAGTLDRVDGFTDPDGKFVSTLKITEADASVKTSATVTAFVEGASGSGTVNFGAPAAFTISPTTETFTLTAPQGSFCTFAPTRTNFTVSGGVPPYTFSVAGLNTLATITQSGVHTTGTFSLPTGGKANDVVTVTDNRGALVTATVNFECNTQTQQ